MERSLRVPELVVYDVDGTMIEDIPGQCTGRAFWRMSELGLLAPNDDILMDLEAMHDLMREDSVPDIWLHNEYSKLIVNEFDSRIGGLRKSDIKKIFEEQADYIASEMIYPEMLDEIEYWREREAAQVLISGSPDLFVQALRRRLNLKWATGTRFFYKNGKIDANRKPSTRGTGKDLIAEKMRLRLSNEMGSQAIFAAAYGDTMSDFSMLQAAEEATAVNPKPDLREKAIELGWRVLDTNNIHAKTA